MPFWKTPRPSPKTNRPRARRNIGFSALPQCFLLDQISGLAVSPFYLVCTPCYFFLGRVPARVPLSVSTVGRWEPNPGAFAGHRLANLDHPKKREQASSIGQTCPWEQTPRKPPAKLLTDSGPSSVRSERGLRDQNSRETGSGRNLTTGRIGACLLDSISRPLPFEIFEDQASRRRLLSKPLSPPSLILVDCGRTPAPRAAASGPDHFFDRVGMSLIDLYKAAGRWMHTTRTHLKRHALRKTNKGKEFSTTAGAPPGRSVGNQPSRCSGLMKMVLPTKTKTRTSRLSISIQI